MTPPATVPSRPSRPSRKKAGLPLLALVAAAVLTLGWRRPDDIATAAVRRGEFLVTVEMRGAVEAQRSVEVNAPNITNLQITWIAATGTEVKAGDPVVRFDSSTARTTQDARVAALRQQQAALDQAKATATITDQQDALDLATDENAVKSAALDASKQAILSPIDGQEAQLTLQMAQEKLRVEQATIGAHQASNAAKIASATRLRDKAQADLDLTESQLKQMVIASPVGGVVTLLTNWSQGFTNAQPFKAGDSVWPSATVAEIPDLSSLEILAKISEIDRGRVRVGEPLRLHLDALPELNLSGAVAAISPMAEPDFNGSWPPPEVFRLTATLAHPDSRLRPDMNGTLDVITQRLPDASSVPAAAVFTMNGQPVIYVQGSGGDFTRVPVRVQAQNPDEIAVERLSGGELPAGTRVALTDPTLPGRGR